MNNFLLYVLIFKIAASFGKKDTINIVAYDKVKGYLNWFQEWFKNAARDNCSTRCVLSDNKNDLEKVDLIIFHAPTRDQSHPSFPPPSSRDRANVIYALVSMEQPKYAPILSNYEALKMFDLMVTYSWQSRYPGTSIPNLPITYFPLNIGVAVVLFTSNCKAAGAVERFHYVQELMKYIPVHSYGKCLNNRQEPEMPEDPKWPAPAQRRARKVKILSYYKFYLAFENFAIDDYVSEKVFEGLIAGALSVYRGSKTISKFMPGNDSYIDANDMNPEALSQLLLSLSSDETKYNKYFEFKARPLTSKFQEMALMSYVHPNVLCRLCEYASVRKNSTRGGWSHS